MKNLIQIVSSQPKVFHRVIAENTNNEQRSIRLLIDNNLILNRTDFILF
ncbi:MAG: hypothetical protein PHS78_06655 [Aliarcobacter skirrowii]|nr:hypothetical protein [Aliarcobacter skirrowii]MDD2508702.1 hypothetical protein [Aliarcobacter skirrowii]MDD3496914.1 hypothetical protein [Aliarcobacter skirrowii]